MKPSEIALGLLRIPTDFVMVMLAFLLAYKIRAITNLIPGILLPLDIGSFPTINEYIHFSISASILFIALFAVRKMYSLKSTSQITHELAQVTINTSAWLMILIAYFFLIRSFPFSRLALIYSWILTIIFISAGRSIIRLLQYWMLKAGIGKKKMLFIGNNTITAKIWNLLSKDLSYQCLGVIDEKHQNQENRTILTETPHGLPHLGPMTELEQIVTKNQIEEIIQTKTDLSKQAATELLKFCREHHLSFSFVPNLLEVQQTNVETVTFAGIPVIQLKPTPLDGWGKVLKRSFDIIASLLALIIFSPILIIIAILIKLDSKGTILFQYLDDGSRVKRVGEHGRLFNFYKFRSMYPNTHNLRYTKLADQNLREGSPLVKIKNDPRITRTGRFLRKTSLDELPQLFNVFKGEMSLVGPRPHLPEEVDKYQKHHKFVLTIKPGITGLAQISGRSDLNFEEEIHLDSYYIEHWSLWLDIKILLKTLLVPFQDHEE